MSAGLSGGLLVRACPDMTQFEGPVGTARCRSERAAAKHLWAASVPVGGVLVRRGGGGVVSCPLNCPPASRQLYDGDPRALVDHHASGQRPLSAHAA